MSDFRTPDGKILRARSAKDGHDTRIQLAVIQQEALDKATEDNVRLVEQRSKLLAEVEELRAEVERLREMLEVKGRTVPLDGDVR